jgi:signal transduction histidine kinase
VEVRVRDTGIGIPAAARDKIFDAFYQIDNSTTRAHEGPGLGLALVRHFVEAHGGKVWVEANEPQGSVFVVRLPSVPPPPTKRIR